MDESNKNLCCICFKIEALQLFELNKLDNDNMTFIDKIQDCIQKNFVNRVDNMGICRNCVTNLDITYKFKNLLLRAHEFWEKQQFAMTDKTCYNNALPILSPDSLVKQELVIFDNNVGNLANEINKTIFLDTDDKTVDNWIDYQPYKCLKCSLNCATAEELLNHICQLVEETPQESNTVDETDSKSETNLTCDLCSVSFNRRYKLRRHRRLHHKTVVEEKKYICTYCDKSFKQSYHLREHITTHTGERNYSCPYCDKKFQRVSSQKRHMRTHEAPPGQKSKKTPFLCTICGKSFPYSNGAQRHMRIHTGVKRFECKICARRFSQSSHLYVHQRTHTGEKPYVCDTCGETFSLKASLQKHMQTHENEPKDNNVVLNKIQFEIQLLERGDVGTITSQMM